MKMLFVCFALLDVKLAHAVGEMSTDMEVWTLKNPIYIQTT